MLLQRLQSQLINDNPDFRKLVEICRTRERSKEQIEEIQGTTQGSHGNADKRPDCPEEVNLVQNDKTCTKCGYAFHKNQSCPAEGKKCKQCGKRNHFASVCRSKKPSKRNATQVKTRKVDSLECEENYFLHAASPTHTQTSGVWKVEFEIEGKPVLINLDTGANCSVISLKQLKAITSMQPEATNT
ncbi:hypothetical protein MTO96_027848 [Rhipicephalus appendiculatus]